MAGLMDILSGAGAALDVPGATVRNALAGRNPFQPISDPFSWEGRTTGRDLLQQYGLAGEDPTGMNMAGGVLAEMALDPLTWAGAGLLSKGLGLGARGAKAASTATRVARPAKALSFGMRPATAASFASPALGAYFIGDNMTVPPEEQEAWKNWLGAGLMAAPLAMAGARGLKGLAKGRQAAAVQAPKEGPFYSRLQEALLNAPDEFRQMPDKVVKGMPEKRMVIPTKPFGIPSSAEKIIPSRPETIRPGQTAYEQLQGYLKERAHPQEIEWVLGDQLKDASTISKQALLDLFEQRKIGLEVGRHGGVVTGPGWQAGARDTSAIDYNVTPYAGDPFPTREAALQYAREAIGDQDWLRPTVRRHRATREHGPLRFPEMLIPGGKNATEVPIRLNVPKPSIQRLDTLAKQYGIADWRKANLRDWEKAGMTQQQTYEIDRLVRNVEKAEGFPDVKQHFGDDVVAWVIHDQRTMPDGRNATFIQEIQSDWHQAGAKQGYRDSTRVQVKPSARAGSWLVFDDTDKFIARVDADTSSQALKKATESFVPDAPFKGNEWTKLGLKQAIDDAIARGDDYVLIADPVMVKRTQGMPIEKARKFYGEIVPNLADEMLKPYGVKLDRMTLPGYKGSRQVLGFRIPDAMKQQVKTRGFPLMSLLPPVAAAAGTQSLRSLLRREPEAA